ncbi:hypothetical protein [Pyxidicoccus xibeiensis]|uniref:hypothetical protein n=1 Tax=Pyxidicoccus xibeiensis TaxID=2906759 RepID=UPI0020A7D396|nr:hypothetical protein [Pyxidicoccus xibeiensis]MCP3141714.1 hypothetical protein [Pyxidicoccus xibeiensis]
MTMATSSKRRRTTLLSSRHGMALACLLTLAAATSAHAQDGSGEPGLRKFGLLLDAGAPHGVGLSAVVRPLPWLRLQAGPTTNTLSFGLRGGASILPLQTFIAPSLNAEAGHYFGSDYNDVVDWLGASPSRSAAAIKDVTYDYVTGSVGLEIGSASRFNFFLHLGISYVALNVDDASALLQDATDDPDVTARDLHVRATIPSVKVGFLFYF